MRLLALAEPYEKRVAVTPDTISRFSADKHLCTILAGAGISASVTDKDFSSAGAKIVRDKQKALANTDLLLCLGPPDAKTISMMPKGAAILGLLDPYSNRDCMEACAKAQINAFSMEFIPRISRAQSMDALSSQANLAGYRAVIEAASLTNRVFPMMITAAGSITPLRLFVMGAGVAGLQAIATARRLGAVVSATDVRPAAKQQVESLSAKFVAVENEEFHAAETQSGYAKPMSENYLARQAELVAKHISTQNIVITTALIPGRKPPVLITEKMVANMQPGSVIIDLAVGQGGNCPLSKPEKIVRENGVLIAGKTQLPAQLAADASLLYSRNLAAFIPLLTDEDGNLSPHWDDEILNATALTRNGQIIHNDFKPQEKNR